MYGGFISEAALLAISLPGARRASAGCFPAYANLHVCVWVSGWEITLLSVQFSTYHITGMPLWCHAGFPLYTFIRIRLHVCGTIIDLDMSHFSLGTLALWFHILAECGRHITRNGKERNSRNIRNRFLDVLDPMQGPMQDKQPKHCIGADLIFML